VARNAITAPVPRVELAGRVQRLRLAGCRRITPDGALAGRRALIPRPGRRSCAPGGSPDDARRFEPAGVRLGWVWSGAGEIRREHRRRVLASPVYVPLRVCRADIPASPAGPAVACAVVGRGSHAVERSVLQPPVRDCRAFLAGPSAHQGRVAPLALTAAGNGRYPAVASMRTGMPADALLGWRAATSTCGFPAPRQGMSPARVSIQALHAKAYDCAHFQPQGS
jgi:hypothetical protein